MLHQIDRESSVPSDILINAFCVYLAWQGKQDVTDEVMRGIILASSSLNLVTMLPFQSVAPGRFEWNLDFKLILMNGGRYSSCEIALRWMSLDVTDDESKLLLVMTVAACHLQYIPRNMHTVLLCFALLWLCNRSLWIHMKYLSIFIRVTLLALGQSLDCHSASEVSLMDMRKSVNL